MITVQKDHIRMDIDEGVLSEHERLGWRIADQQDENETNALKSALNEAQAKIVELETKLSKLTTDKQPESKTEPKKGKGE